MVIIDEKDIGKTKEELLMDLIAEWLGERIPLDKIVYGLPEELDQRPDLPYDPNTFVPARVDIRYDDRYSEQGSGFMYRRRSIVEHLAGCDLSTITPLKLPFTIHDLIDQINKCVPYPIDKDDLVNHKYETKEDYENGIHIQAHPHSYLWMDGEKVKIDDRWIDGIPLLKNTRLNGFFKWKPVDAVAFAAAAAQAAVSRERSGRLAAARNRVADRLDQSRQEQGLRPQRNHHRVK